MVEQVSLGCGSSHPGALLAGCVLCPEERIGEGASWFEQGVAVGCDPSPPGAMLAYTAFTVNASGRRQPSAECLRHPPTTWWGGVLLACGPKGRRHCIYASIWPRIEKNPWLSPSTTSQPATTSQPPTNHHYHHQPPTTTNHQPPTTNHHQP